MGRASLRLGLILGRATSTTAEAGFIRLRPLALEHDPEKWEPVFGKRSCSNKKIERDDDSKKNHPALAIE
jgi:hypothetical protein